MFLKWTLLSLNLETSTIANGDISPKIIKRLTIIAYPDEAARYELSHVDLHCLQRYMYLFWVNVKGGLLFGSSHAKTCLWA